MNHTRRPQTHCVPMHRGWQGREEAGDPRSRQPRPAPPAEGPGPRSSRPRVLVHGVRRNALEFASPLRPHFPGELGDPASPGNARGREGQLLGPLGWTAAPPAPRPVPGRRPGPGLPCRPWLLRPARHHENGTAQQARKAPRCPTPALPLRPGRGDPAQWTAWST